MTARDYGKQLNKQLLTRKNHRNDKHRKERDRKAVKRRIINSFRYQHERLGTIIANGAGINRWQIKWDDKASTGQQLSTINARFLERPDSNMIYERIENPHS